VHEARLRLGVIGGSFDPPHLGHLVIASEAHALLGLERVLFVPAAAPPHKDLEERTAADVRLQMTALAIADDTRFAASGLEIEHGLVYTRDTLTAVAERYPGRDLVFIMGSDSLLQFDAWHDPEGILERCILAVAPRRAGARRGSPSSRLRRSACRRARSGRASSRACPFAISCRCPSRSSSPGAACTGARDRPGTG
jgi:nicotinate-nucleotide adenylyltransferase